MHEGIFIPESGQLPQTLTANATGANKDLKMSLDEPFLMISVIAKSGLRVEVAVPLTNVKAIQMAPKSSK